MKNLKSNASNSSSSKKLNDDKNNKDKVVIELYKSWSQMIEESIVW